jgi:hypothetical protein
MIATQLHRFITVYQLEGDSLVEQVTLSDREFDAIRSLLGCDDSDVMLDAYPLKDDVLRRTMAMLNGRLPQGAFEYFLETEVD